MQHLLYSALLMPLLGFISLVSFSSLWGRKLAGWIGCSTIFFAFVSFATLLMMHVEGGAKEENFTLYSWISTEALHVDFTLHVDPLSLLMTLIITGIGFLIHVYSIGYMSHDHDVIRYFACMNFFVFAMLLLVLAENVLLLFVGWEGVGLASYLLIGFWYPLPKAAEAATKAFVVNRVGDVGLLLGILLTFTLFGTGDITSITQQAGTQFAGGAPILTVLTLLYFFGAIGKSAQLPLQVWLPDAMAGPTPVSALIHAATMVTAGVYLVVRLHALFLLTPFTLQVIGIVGGITSLYAALSATAQTDLKRVLAFSTISQLGLMFLACSVGAFYSAMFHLTTHAFVKALLFLSAGNVVHMMHGTTDMNKMGGLGKIFTKTQGLFFIGLLALSGIPPLSVFFSKELILEEEHLYGSQTLFYVALAASVLTAFYLTRAYCLTFRGTSPIEKSVLSSIKEAPRLMLLPLAILALLSIGGGFLGFTFGKVPILQEFLSQLMLNPIEKEFGQGAIFTFETLIGTLGAIAGALAAALFYGRGGKHLRGNLSWLKHAFYVDEIYTSLVVAPAKKVAKWTVHFWEPKVFDGSIRMMTSATQKSAALLQLLQSGQIRSYVAWMVVGSVVIVAYFVF